MPIWNSLFEKYDIEKFASEVKGFKGMLFNHHIF